MSLSVSKFGVLDPHPEGPNPMLAWFSRATLIFKERVVRAALGTALSGRPAGISTGFPLRTRLTDVAVRALQGGERIGIPPQRSRACPPARGIFWVVCRK